MDEPEPIDTDDLRTIRDFLLSPDHTVEVTPETIVAMATEVLVLRGKADLHSECNCDAGSCDDCRLGDDNHILSLRRLCLARDNAAKEKPAGFFITVREVRAVLNRIDGEIA